MNYLYSCTLCSHYYAISNSPGVVVEKAVPDNPDLGITSRAVRH